MRLHLTHGIQHDTDQNEHARAAKESGHGIGNPHDPIHQDGNDCDHGQKDGARQRNPAHGVVQVTAGGLTGPNSRDIAAVLLQVIGDLQFVELRGDPEIREKEEIETEKCKPLLISTFLMFLFIQFLLALSS